MNKIIHGNCLEKLKTIKENSVDSIITDPPYELGFMGKSWDNSGIAYNIEMWRECFRVLKPGGHLLSFGGTRTYHRMAVAIEDAGFEIRDMIEWVYGSGFPKSRNIGKDIEKHNVGGIKNLKQIGTKQGIKCETGTQGYSYSKEYVAGKCMGGKQISGQIPVYEINNEYEGWGTALKPAHEPICMARKPLSEKTIAENCLKWRTGGINIDESRVRKVEGDRTEYGRGHDLPHANTTNSLGKFSKVTAYEPDSLGRFPANLIHDNSEEVRECFPENAGGNGCKSGGFDWTKSGKNMGLNLPRDKGNASRFFKSIIYQAKASKSERNKGCEGLEKRMVHRMGHGNNEPDPKTQAFITQSRNNHPTVKPIALMEYLIKMITPKGGIVLDPFAGSGTTLVAAKKNDFQYIGIEMIEEYIPIIQCRVDAVKAARARLLLQIKRFRFKNKRLKFTNNETPQSQKTKIKRRSSPPPQDNSTPNTKSKRKIKRREK